MLKGGFGGAAGGDGGWCCSPKVRRLSGVTGGARAGSWQACAGVLVGERRSGGSSRGRLAGEGVLDEVFVGVRPW